MDAVLCLLAINTMQNIECEHPIVKSMHLLSLSLRRWPLAIVCLFVPWFYRLQASSWAILVAVGPPVLRSSQNPCSCCTRCFCSMFVQHSSSCCSVCMCRVLVQTQLMLHCVFLQSASNLLNRFRGSDSNLYQRNLEAQALLAQQQALGLGIHGLSSQTALDLLQVCTNPIGL